MIHPGAVQAFKMAALRLGFDVPLGNGSKEERVPGAEGGWASLRAIEHNGGGQTLLHALTGSSRLHEDLHYDVHLPLILIGAVGATRTPAVGCSGTAAD